jgi:anaerobic C4-dicarboxylate transporter
MSNKIKDKDDQLISNSLNTPLNKISNEELISKINFKKKLSIIIFITSIVIIIIYLIIISQYINKKEEKEKEKPKINK